MHYKRCSALLLGLTLTASLMLHPLSAFARIGYPSTDKGPGMTQSSAESSQAAVEETAADTAAMAAESSSASESIQESMTETKAESDAAAATAAESTAPITDEGAEKTGRYRSIPAGDIPADLNLDQIVAEAGLDLLGEGNTPADPILGVTPRLHYAMMNTANVRINYTESHLNTYLYNPAGFSRLYIDHVGIGRYYYRAYTVQNGWTPWANSKQSTPGANEGHKIQAIQIRVKGYTANLTDIYYKAVLNDGTVLDWAKDGETLGSLGTGRYIVALKIALWNNTVPFPGKRDTLTQSQFYDGTYLEADGSVAYSTADGSPYTGWGIYDNKHYYFQDGVRQTGWHYLNGYKYYFREDGSLESDLETVMEKPGDYILRYNKATKTMYVMAKDGNNGYIIPYKTFMTSNGPETPLGTFKTYQKYRWKIMHHNIYCQYLTRFHGPFLFHSIIFFDRPTSHNLDSSTYNYMDDAVSGGCIRLLSGDAAWLHDHVRLQTTVQIYADPWNKGPIEKDAIQKPIPREQNFDPSDPLIVAQRLAQEASDEAAAAAAAAAQAASDEAAAAAQAAGAAGLDVSADGAAVY